MGMYKEGEGKIYFQPTHFICPALKEGVDYQVILLGGTDIVLFENGVFGEEHLNQDVFIKYNNSMDILTMTIPEGLYYTHYVENYDLVIRVGGLTQLILANLREDKPEEDEDEGDCP